MQELAFHEIPNIYEIMRNRIRNKTLQYAYSQFNFLYFSFSDYNNAFAEQEDVVYTFIFDYLKDYNFLTFRLIKEINNKKIPPNPTLIICCENKCLIIEEINITFLDILVDDLNKINKKSIIDADFNYDLSHKISITGAKEEIASFCKHFYREIETNIFVSMTIKPICGFLIRRYFYPTNYFKDPSFFNFYQMNYLKRKDQLLINKIRGTVHSDIEVPSNMIDSIDQGQKNLLLDEMSKLIFFTNSFSYSNLDAELYHILEEENDDNSSTSSYEYEITPFGSFRVRKDRSDDNNTNKISEEEEANDQYEFENEEANDQYELMNKNYEEDFEMILIGDSKKNKSPIKKPKENNDNHSNKKYEITPFGNLILDEINDSEQEDEHEDKKEQEQNVDDDFEYDYQSDGNKETEPISYDFYYQANYREFIESDFIKLRTISANESSLYVLVLHIESLYIFLMKKVGCPELITRMMEHEIYFCKNYTHRCLTHFYGFLTKEKRIIGFIYEFMSNGSLDSYVTKHKEKINEFFSLMTISRLFQTIKYLHSNSLINRDIKPSNIMLDHDNIPYINDFETIRQINNANDNENNNMTFNIGSFNYTSPELDSGEEVSYPTDIYSFGLIIYFLFEKKNMFSQKGYSKSSNNHDFRQTNFTQNIQNLVEKCIRINPKERPSCDQIITFIYNEVYDSNKLIRFFLEEDQLDESLLIQYISENYFLGGNFGNFLDKILYFFHCKINNDYSSFYSELGDIFWNNGKFENAIKYYNLIPHKTKKNYFILGQIYYFGEAIEPDIPKSIEYFEKASKLHHPLASLFLGLFYECGFYVKKDYLKAKEYFELSAEDGEAMAFSYIGELYENGWGVIQDYKRAKYYYEETYHKGDNCSLHKIGRFYEKSLGVKQNYFKARNYYEMTPPCYETEFLINLGDIYKNGLGIKKNYAQARFYYEMAYQHKNYYGLNRIGELYEMGLGVKQNIRIAHQYYEYSAHFNNPEALFYLGYFYSTGDYIGIDIEKAIDYFTKCSKIHYEKVNIDDVVHSNLLYRMKYNPYYYRSLNDLGLIYLIVLHDVKKANEYIKESGLNEYPFGQNNYGLLNQFYLNHNGNAEYMYERASKHNFPIALYNLGYLREKEERIDESIECYIKASQNENAQVFFHSQYHYDKRLEISTTFIICLTNMILVDYYLSLDNLEESKKYFIKSLSKIKIDDENTPYSFEHNFQIKKDSNNIFSDLEKFILDFPLFNLHNQPNFNLDDVISSFHPIKTKDKDNNNQSTLNNMKFDLENEKNNKKTDSIDFMMLDDFETVEQISFDKPEDLFNFAIDNIIYRKLFIDEIDTIINIMKAIIYKEPYQILFGRINIESPEKMKIYYPYMKEINEYFYQGFGIEEN